MAGYKGPYKGAFNKGDAGKDVSAVERMLKRTQNNNAIKPGGTFGIPAEAALKHFQKQHGLHVDGVYGPRTHDVMAPLMRGYEIFLYKQAKARPNVMKSWAVMGPHADRDGVSTHQDVKDFVSKVAHINGAPLIITTGTNHNQYVAGSVPPRESRHWTGNAADVAMYGTSLTKLGQSALIAAGMPVWRAKLCRGGVYNVGGWNILFNTTVGGNHYNHCHMGD